MRMKFLPLLFLMLTLPIALSLNLPCNNEMRQKFWTKYNANLTDMYMDGKNNTANEYWEFGDEWNNVLWLVSGTSCNYDTISLVPSYSMTWFRDLDGSDRRAFYLFEDTKSVGYFRFFGVMQVGEDIYVMNNMTGLSPSCDFFCLHFLDNERGQVYFYWDYISPSEQSAGTVVNTFSDYYQKRYQSRLYHHEKYPLMYGSQRFIGLESHTTPQMTTFIHNITFIFNEYSTNATERVKIRYNDTSAVTHDTKFGWYRRSSYDYCRDINTSGTYTLTQDIISVVPRVSCLNITANNVIINLNGHSVVKYSAGAGTGIYVNSLVPFTHVNNVQIIDGGVSGFANIGRVGIELGWVKNSYLNGISVTGNEVGIKAMFVENTRLDFIDITGNQKGMKLDATYNITLNQITGLNVVRDLDINFMRNSTIMNYRFGLVIITSPAKWEKAGADYSIECLDCWNNAFWNGNIYSESRDFNLNGTSYGNQFVRMNLLRGFETEQNGLFLLSGTYDNYGCEVIGYVSDSGTNNVITNQTCPPNIIITPKVCSVGTMCIDNVTKVNINADCSFTNTTTCSYLCSNGQCIEQPPTQWVVSSLPLIFTSPTSKMFFILISASLTGGVLSFKMKSWLLPTIITMFIIIFGIVIGFIPLWIGITIIIICIALLVMEFMRMET